jgi:hypothetical protein
MAPNQSFHVKYEINGTAGSESYVLKVSDMAITWLQDGEMSHPWVPDAPGVNILSFLSDASAFSQGAGAGNVYFDNLVIINNDLPPGLDGDYNQNGVVDGADYVVWRKTDGTPAGYSLWRSNFGATGGSGSAAASASAVPEPASLVLVLLAFALASVGKRRLHIEI